MSGTDILFKQLLVNGQVLWEEDVAGGSAGRHQVSVDATSAVRGRTNAIVAFRLLDKKAVSNFGVHWRLDQLQLARKLFRQFQNDHETR